MKIRWRALFSLVILLLAAATPTSSQTEAPGPTEFEALTYTREFFPGARYDDSVPTPESLLGFPIGEKTASPAQIEVKAAA